MAHPGRDPDRVLDDRQYVYQASSDVNGGTVTVGYPYSLLEWCAEPHSSWSLPVDIRRVPSTQTAQAVGAEQIQALAKARSAYLEVLDIIAADGKYGNAGFLRSVKGLRCAILARLRADRVLYGPAPLPDPHRKGRPRIHGQRFAFKEPETWGEPAEVIELEDAYWGMVRLERWCQLHEQKGADVPYDVIRARVHLEREKPPAALWLAWLAPAQFPPGMTLTVETIWRAYVSRWPVEAGIHFRKDTLGWTRPRFHSKEVGDRWTELTALACWIMFLTASHRRRPAVSMAESAAALDPAAGSAEHPADFREDWQPSSPPKSARKSARMDQRQSKSGQTALQSGQKDPGCGENGLKFDW